MNEEHSQIKAEYEATGHDEAILAFQKMLEDVEQTSDSIMGFEIKVIVQVGRHSVPLPVYLPSMGYDAAPRFAKMLCRYCKGMLRHIERHRKEQESPCDTTPPK